MQSFLVSDKNLWVDILYVFYCITLVYALKKSSPFDGDAANSDLESFLLLNETDR